MRCIVAVVLLLLYQVIAEVSVTDVSRANNEFANKLYQEVAKEPGNVLVCPISLHVALALVHQGADGNTAAELATALKLNGEDERIRVAYDAILTKLKDNTLKMAVKLFPAAGYSLNKNYIAMARANFKSDVEGVDYRNPALAAATINKYVEDNTNGKIHNLISADKLSEMTRFIIINAVHFQAYWKKPFPGVYDDYFRPSPNGKKIETKFMTQSERFEFKEDEVLDAQVLKMDYNVSDYSMIFILPNGDKRLADVEKKLSGMSLEDILSNMVPRRVEVTIPSFKLEQTIPLSNHLKKLGVKDLFSSNANLRKVANDDYFFVSNIIQKTFIDVNQDGTEAAAATGFIETLSATNDEFTFLARKPFTFYLIRSAAPKMILFRGRFVRPQELSQPQQSGRPDKFSESFNENEATGNNQNAGSNPPNMNYNPQNPSSQGSGNQHGETIQQNMNYNPQTPSSQGSGNQYGETNQPNTNYNPQNPPSQSPGNSYQISNSGYNENQQNNLAGQPIRFESPTGQVYQRPPGYYDPYREQFINSRRG